MRATITILLSLGLLLAACETSDDPQLTPDVSPEISPEVSPAVSPDAAPEVSPDISPELSPEASPEVSPEPSPEVSPQVSPGVGLRDCREAFAEVPDLDELETFSDVREAIEALDETIRACDTLDEWVAEAEDHLAALDVDERGARDFVEHRCDENDDLDDAALCEEVDDDDRDEDEDED